MDEKVRLRTVEEVSVKECGVAVERHRLRTWPVVLVRYKFEEK